MLLLLIFSNMDRKWVSKNTCFHSRTIVKMLHHTHWMLRLAVDFYSNPYAAEISDEHFRNELLKDLPILSEEQKKSV